jgi:prephenate dehydrogenase
MTGKISAPFSHVHIVGTGLLGTSAGLALRDRGVSVTLEDASPQALSLAEDYGAGVRLGPGDPEPQLVIVATPPDVVADVVVRQLEAFPSALVMDVASVKAAIARDVASASDHSARFVPTHPMAGRERGGAVSGRSDLFTARPWVICPQGSDVLDGIRALVVSLGALPIEMSPEEHDDAVALMSHVPQLVSSLTAARLRGASELALGLAGGGIRDVTRIAQSDPTLWIQILAANSAPIASHLKTLRDDLDQVLGALEKIDSAGSQKILAEALGAGVSGVSRLPGKHGTSAAFASLIVVIDDSPGELARLLTQLGEWGVNLEDLRLEHSPGAQVGFADLTLAPEVVTDVESRLRDAGWRIAGERA